MRREPCWSVGIDARDPRAGAVAIDLLVLVSGAHDRWPFTV